ncbi:MAG: AAA family ATPase [Nocardioides sp.]
MAWLIHLNGAPGVGKSTVAQRYADHHPGVLNLDIDRLVPLIGGWQEDFFGSLPAARNLALAMASDHLARGTDVVMPQLVTAVDQATRFEAAAGHAGAAYVEIALHVEPHEQALRFRGKPEASPVDRHVKQYIEDKGGDATLRRIRGHFLSYLTDRPLAQRLDTDGMDPDATYDVLLAALH